MIDSINVSSGIYSVQNKPANIPIEGKMTAQETGLEQGSENSQDAISLLKTAEGSLESVMESLQGIRELAVQANNSFLTDSDKGFIQDQIEGFKESINDALKNTEFNTIKVLENGFEGQVQTGANEGQGQMMRIENTSLEALGIENFSVRGDFNLDDVDSAIETVSQARSSIGAQTNGLESTIRSNDVARENTLASKSNLEDDFVKQIMEVKKNEYLNEYKLQMQKLEMDSSENELSILG